MSMIDAPSVLHYDGDAMGLPGWRMAAVTHPGRVRSHNEDAVLLLPGERAAVLADGMGGHAAGEVASTLAVAAAADALAASVGGPAATRVRQACLAAHDAVAAGSQREPAWRGMGSTLLVLLAQGPSLVCGHIGDSRAYRWRDQRLNRLTVDHSMAETLARAGVQDPDRLARARHVLTRAIGTDPTVTPDIKHYRWRPADRYLLCSDGLTEALTDAEIAEIMRIFPDDIDSCLRELVLAANLCGGPDNISAILMQTAGA